MFNTSRDIIIQTNIGHECVMKRTCAIYKWVNLNDNSTQQKVYLSIRKTENIHLGVDALEPGQANNGCFIYVSPFVRPNNTILTVDEIQIFLLFYFILLEINSKS